MLLLKPLTQCNCSRFLQ